MKAVMQYRTKTLTNAHKVNTFAHAAVYRGGESIKAAIQEVTRVRGFQNFEGEDHMNKTTLVPLVSLICAPFQEASAQTLSGPSYSEWRIAPSSITVHQGSFSGLVSALAIKDQTG